MGPSELEQFPQLSALSHTIESCDLGGYEECSALPNQPVERREQYLAIMGRDFTLFHKSERLLEQERNHFLKRITEAYKHFLDVYLRDCPSLDGEEYNLPQHPSHGMKELADRVYNLFEQHWKCHCAQRSAGSPGAREARISLTRHRLLLPKLPLKEVTVQGHVPAKFEVLLPVCKDNVEWKVTNVEVIRRNK